MTKVTVFTKQGEYTGFICESHSGYSEAGSDIVCASVSALVINTVNSITELTKSELDVKADEENARISAFFKGCPDPGATLLIRSLILGISSIEDEPDTADYVDLIIEEVN